MVKANAYGLGVGEVAPALVKAGCRDYFVATAEEGVALRKLVGDAAIHVLHGVPAGAEGLYVRHRLVPVLTDLGQVERWRLTAGRRGPLPAAIHLDTGLNRLGMPPAEQEVLLGAPDLVRPFRSVLWISHLACSEEPAHPMNRTQLGRFRSLLQRLPKGLASFANSSGIYLGAEAHFDIARPGYALYGGNPTPWRPSQMRQVVHLTAEILQVRDVDTPGTVGYGAAHRVAGPTRVATIPVGYADGYLRSLSGRGHALLDGHTVPVIGRVSMDLVTLDVSAVPPKAAQPGSRVTLIGGRMTLDDVATRAGTIGYELLVALGDRYARRYVEGVAAR